MVIRKKEGALRPEECRIVKALLARDWRNQDIQDLLNRGRGATINSGRITEVKYDESIPASEDEEVDFFIAKKEALDPKTGLNLFDDERLIRAREAISLAVHVFNSPTSKFKTEIFAVLANIAWTYLLHEYYVRKGIPIADEAGRTTELSALLERHDCPLTDGVRRNLKAVKSIRDTVEHRLLGRSDPTWFTLFQACCLNFENTICTLFGNNLSLTNELTFALQFAKLNIEQISTIHKYDIPDYIESLDAQLQEGLTEDQKNDLEYRIRVVYTLESSTRSRAHIQFVKTDAEDGAELRNVLVKTQSADDTHPHKPKMVCAAVRARTGRAFSLSRHTDAWKRHQVRPQNGSRNPAQTNREYCIYHAAHRDYTYSDAWVSLLADEIETPTARLAEHPR